MQNAPFFTIITATKNVDKTIERTLISIENQGFTNYEHIVIDSCSTDSTLSILTAYQHSYPLNYVSEPDSGISDAFNKGVKLSTGRWILFLGAGDELVSPFVLEQAHEILTRRLDRLIVWGNVIFKKINHEIGRTYQCPFPISRLKRYMCYPHQAMFHQRRLFEQYGYYDTSLKATMDYDLLLRAYRELQYGYVDFTIAYMLVGGASQNVHNAAKETLQIQLKHKLLPKPFAYGFYYWTLFKYRIKKQIGYSVLFGFQKAKDSS